MDDEKDYNSENPEESRATLKLVVGKCFFRSRPIFFQELVVECKEVLPIAISRLGCTERHKGFTLWEYILIAATTKNAPVIWNNNLNGSDVIELQ